MVYGRAETIYLTSMKYKLSLIIEAPKYTAPGDWPESAWAEEILSQIFDDSRTKAIVKIMELGSVDKPNKKIKKELKWWENRLKGLDKIKATIKWEKK